MYEKTIWYDHATDPANCFAVTDNGDGTKTIIRAGTVLQQGTAVSAEHLNHMEEGIAASAEKVSGATPGNLAGLDANGNLVDSGKKPADFANAAHGHGILDITGAIGGQQLLKNSGFIKDSTNWSLNTNVTRDTARKLDGAVSVKSQQTGLAVDSFRGITVPNADAVPCAQGDVLSFYTYIYVEDYTTFDGNIRVICIVKNAGDVDVQYATVFFTPTASHNGKWTRVGGTITITAATAAKLVFGVHVIRNGTAWFVKPKVESGNIATDWNPSWADMLAVNPSPLTLIEDYISATLLNSYTGWIRYSKSATGHATVRFSITPGTTTAGTQQAVLPTGYRPSVGCAFQLANNTTYQPVNFRLNGNGQISNVDALTAGVTYSGSFTFLAE